MMRALCIAALAGVLPASIFYGEQDRPGAQPVAPDASQNIVRVYSPGPDTAAPVLLPHDFPLASGKDCKVGPTHQIPVLVVVDAQGTPHLEPLGESGPMRQLLVVASLGVNLFKPFDTAWERWADLIVRNDRFKPGIHGNAPVAITQLALVTIKSCVRTTKGEKEQKYSSLYLDAQPVQEFTNFPELITGAVFNADGSIESFSTPKFQEVYLYSSEDLTKPQGWRAPPVLYPPVARTYMVQGACWISVIVDQRGKPEDVHVTQCADSRLASTARAAILVLTSNPRSEMGNQWRI